MDKPLVGGGLTLQDDWRTAGADTFSLTDHASVTNPVLDETHVTDITNPLFLADPFLTKNGSTYYLFYEVGCNDGSKTARLSYSSSSDGYSGWTYGAEILGFRGETNQSYPFVFKMDGEWWMIPDLQGTSVQLFHALSFPASWEYIGPLMTQAYQIRDATPFQYNGYWYILLRDNTAGALRLFYNNYLVGPPWTEHPSSPILSGDRNSRCGGRPIIRASSVDIYLQDNVTIYGNKVRAYRLTNLSPTTVTVSELGTSPVLDATGNPGDWNEDGMHQLDRVNSGLSVVDGFYYDTTWHWKLGFYQDS